MPAFSGSSGSGMESSSRLMVSLTYWNPKARTTVPEKTMGNARASSSSSSSAGDYSPASMLVVAGKFCCTASMVDIETVLKSSITIRGAGCIAGRAPWTRITPAAGENALGNMDSMSIMASGGCEKKGASEVSGSSPRAGDILRNHGFTCRWWL